MSVLIAGQENSILARHIAQHVQSDFIPISVGYFADGEAYISIKDTSKLANQHVLVVYQFLYSNIKNLPPISLNDQIMSLFLCLDRLVHLQVKKITLFLPYLPYSRQNQSSCKQFDGPIYMLGKFFQILGASSLQVGDVHAPQIIKRFPISFDNLSFDRFWQQIISMYIIKNHAPDDFCLVSPDQGGYERVSQIATSMGFPSAYICKKRVSNDVAVGYELVGNVRGKRIILIDDIIDTGRTAISAVELLLDCGAELVYGCFTHAVLSEGAQERIAKSRFEKVFVTNTILGVDIAYPDSICLLPSDDYMTAFVNNQIKQLSKEIIHDPNEI